MQLVAIAPAAKAVGAFEKFVANAGAPLGGQRRDIGNFLEMEIFGVVAADNHGESVFETERLGDFEVKELGVELLDALVNGGGITLRRFVKDGSESSASVFDVEVKLAGLESFMNQ